MSQPLKTQLSALACGLVFGVGLSVSQMVNPDKVRNFLDIFGQFDPSLMLVMAGALSVFALIFFAIVKQRKNALNGDTLNLARKSKLDGELVIGAVIFGIGWGLSGICPGPAFTNISGLQGKVLVFISMMLAGIWLADKVKQHRRKPM
ncbi:DUF6691 family protein [Thalassotalea maritima]|uniref:DUF6691 family protein n=1 Tax=Thalassotalea maritima TaxID=3242416 RepID=UPI0035295C10